MIVQDRSPRFEVGLYLKNLRDHIGTYAYLKTILALLTGFRPEGYGPLYAEEESFEDMTDDGYWLYSLTFTFETVHVQADEEELDLLTVGEATITLKPEETEEP